ncbi:MAG: CDP-alcohol phosphatidyltransferase family protein [Patescibacteria group bacterium]
MPLLGKKILEIGNTEFKEPNAIDKLLDKLFLWLIPSYIKPNHLTAFRYLTVPIIFYFLLNNLYLSVLFLFLLSAFTDALDGALARTRNQITSWGKLHDPLADKLLIGVVGVILITEYIGIEIIFMILILELLTIVAAVSLYDPKDNPGARLPGKVKMFCQSFGLISLLVFAITGAIPFLITATLLLYLAILFSVINTLLCTFFTKAL